MVGVVVHLPLGDETGRPADRAAALVTQERRAFLRFFACEQDLTHEPADAPLPAAVAAGEEPYLVVGAVAGG